MLRPRGPVAVFGASNFPFAFGTVGGDTASALAAGYPVIVKGHPSHPGTANSSRRAVLAAIDGSQAAAGPVRAAPGPQSRAERRAGEAPADHRGRLHRLAEGRPRALFDLAAARPTPIPVYAEMGSVNPLVDHARAPSPSADAIAQGLAGIGAAGRRTVLHQARRDLHARRRPIHSSRALAKQIIAAPPDDDAQPRPARHVSAPDRRVGHVGGVKVHVTPKPVGARRQRRRRSSRPSADFFNASVSLREEAFGPAALVVHCDDAVRSQLAASSQLGGSLTGTVHIGAGRRRARRSCGCWNR